MSMEVVVVTFNSATHIGPCIASIVRNGATPILVDNGSTDDTLAIARRQCADVRIIPTGRNIGYGKAMKLGFQQTSSQFVVLSNPDVVYPPHSIAPLVEYLKKHPDAAIVGPQLMFPDGKWQRSYGDLPGLWPGFKDAIGINSIKNWARRWFWPRKLERKPKDVPYVDGAVWVVRREAFTDLGGFDERFYFYGEESDLCARAHKSGWRTVFNPDVCVMHVRGGSSGQAGASERLMRYLITGQALLATTYLRPWKRYVYYWLERIASIRLAVTYRILGYLRHSATCSNMAKDHERYARLWQEQMGKDPQYDIAPPLTRRDSPLEQESANG